MTSEDEFKKYLAEHFTPEKQQALIDLFESAPKFLLAIEKLTLEDVKLALKCFE